jgi:hAT family C-terminal dimerisation region
MIEGKQFPVLRSVALIVFGMVTSSASSERNFSATGFIHSKLRNSLKPENVFKLVYIKTNAAQLGYGSSTNEKGDSDDEQEIVPIDDEE